MTMMRKLSGKVLGAEAAHGGSILGGMILAKGAQKLVGQDNLMINGATALVGLAGAALFEHNILRAISQGIFIFGSIKTLTTVAKDVAPVGVNGLGFTAPEPIRKFINDWVPTLGNTAPVYVLPAATPMGNLSTQQFAMNHEPSQLFGSLAA